ncbi:hypothetical protein [Pararcticibacter amylolyticus]|nr:hypothetical protein [Pararcticibacter amylolyticus]
MMVPQKKNLLQRVRIVFTVLITVLSFGGVMAMKAAQTPTYYMRGDEYLEVPGGAAGEGTQWECNSGSSICTYDENHQPIGSANRQFNLLNVD